MSRLFTSESVGPGHPDKVCDQISDATVDFALEQNPRARVAVETAIKRNVTLLGEISGVEVSREAFHALVERVLRGIGYTNKDSGFDVDRLGLNIELTAQSADIALGVDERTGHEQGAGDQGLMFGYASNETPELMPLPIAKAHALMKRLTELRKNGTLDYLQPDAKSQVTVEYNGSGKAERIAAVVLSAQHKKDVSQEQLRRDIRQRVIDEVCSGLTDAHTVYHINPTGSFEIGGPEGDSGVTGRKIIVDTYGGAGRHGGGAFSGKDPSKVDRSAAYAGRWVAKSVVAAGLAKRCEVQIAYAIGVAEPVSVWVETYGTATVPEEHIARAIQQEFDLRPASIIRDLDLLKPQYEPLATFGHMGREDLGVAWENTDRAETLKKAAIGPQNKRTFDMKPHYKGIERAGV